MKFETADGRYFSLKVEQYESPDEALHPTEDNPAEDFDTGRFLIVSHTFKNADGEWNARGPTMTTCELLRFRDWLASIHRRNPTTYGVYFTERDLEFSVDQVLQNLRVHVSYDFLPSWAKSAKSVSIDFPIKDLDLERVIADLDDQLVRFPGLPPIENPTEQRDAL
jgi:hypothetical protein